MGSQKKDLFEAKDAIRLPVVDVALTDEQGGKS